MYHKRKQSNTLYDEHNVLLQTVQTCPPQPALICPQLPSHV